jgi:hypothetical protein
VAEKGQDEILVKLAEQAEKFSTVGELFKVFAQKLTEHEKRLAALETPAEKPEKSEKPAKTTSKSKKAPAK